MDSQNTQFNSILDKVMAASQEQELASFNPVDIVPDIHDKTINPD